MYMTEFITCRDYRYQYYEWRVDIIYLLLKLIQRGWTFRHALLSVGLNFLRSQYVVIQQELPHKLISVIDPQVCVRVKRVPVLTCLVHYT